ncbi:Trehalose import ATP-binding protein SugC [Leptolyngbya sp. O-77]|nr:Trehalose import ATP-binding protein SugC [Leptolyngbya sp. O-77]
MNTPAAFTLSDVSKVYSNGTVALQNLDLTVQEGQFVSLLGPSGCGKSTVLRMVAGLGKMSSGNLYWGGSSQRKLAYVFQEAALMPWATVEDNVALPLKLSGLEKARRGRRCRRRSPWWPCKDLKKPTRENSLAECGCASPSPAPW